MTHIMHENSISAYFDYVKPNLTESQQKVFSVFLRGGNFTDLEISEALQEPINKISGRVGELIRKEVIRALKDHETNIRGRRVCTLAERKIVKSHLRPEVLQERANSTLF